MKPKRRRTRTSRISTETLEVRLMLAAASSFTIKFDYRYDTNGFFDDSTQLGRDRRRVLDLAADVFEARITTTRQEVSRSVRIIHPGTGEEKFEIPDFTTAKNVYTILAGGRPMEVTRAGFGGHWGFPGALPDVGHVTFNSDPSKVTWHSDRSEDGLDPGESDLFSVAQHEIMHALGLKGSDHLQTADSGDHPLFASSQARGTRGLMTDADWAVLRKRGWTVSRSRGNLVDVDATRYLWGAAYSDGSDREPLAFNDLRQGASDTCSFTATLASVARTNFDLASGIRLKEQIDDENYLFEVRMFREGTNGTYQQEWIEVPFDSFITMADMQSNDPGEFWPALFLRAYRSFSFDVDRNYRSMSGSLRALTGMDNTRLRVDGSVSQANQMLAALRQGSPIVAGTLNDGPFLRDAVYGLARNHAYSVLGMEVHSPNPSEIYVTLRNPWADDTTVSFFDKNEDGVSLDEYAQWTAGIDGLNDGIIRIPWTVFSEHFEDVVISHQTGPSINEPQKPNQVVQFQHDVLGPYTVKPGEVFSLDLNAVDPEGRFIHYTSAWETPGYVHLTSGQFRWEVQARDVGSQIITVRAKTNPYDGASISFVVHVLPSIPTIGTLTAEPVEIGTDAVDELTLTANDVATDVGSIDFVRFWRDVNRDGSIDPDRDAFVGHGRSVTGGWSWSGYVGGMTPGRQTFLAQAGRYSFGDLHLSEIASTTLTAVPTVQPEPVAFAVSDPVTSAGGPLAGEKLHVTAPLPDGTYRLLWADANSKAFTQTFDALGQPIDAAVELTSVTLGGQQDLSVLPNGEFVVAWSHDGKLYGQWFDTTATPVGNVHELGEFQAEFGYDGPHIEIAPQINRTALVVYSHGAIASEDVFLAGFEASDGLTGPSIPLSESTEGSQTHPTIAINENGDGIISWSDNQNSKIMGRRFSYFGDDLDEEFVIAEFQSTTSKLASAINAFGESVVAYNTAGNDIAAAFFGSNRRTSDPVRVNSFRAQERRIESVAINDNGWSVFTWWSRGQDPADHVNFGVGSFARMVDPMGIPAGPDFPVHTTYDGDQYPRGVAIDDHATVTTVFEDITTATLDIRRFETNRPPVISNDTPHVAENSANGTVVGRIEASDPDGTVDAFTYVIVGESPFEIDENSGEIRVIDSTALNYDANQQLHVAVRITENAASNPQASVVVVPIQLSNVWEPPVAQDAPFSLPELSPRGTIVGAAVVDDPDLDDMVRFAVTAGTPFNIDEATGMISVVDQLALDFESQPELTIDVTVTDRGGLQDTALITIQLTDVDESTINMAPVIQTTVDQQTYYDGQPEMRVLSAVAITDADSSNFEGGHLRVENIGFPYEDDQLNFSAAGVVVHGTDVFVDGTNIGTMTQDGSGGSALQVAFNVDASPERVSTLLGAVSFQTPVVERPSDNRMLRFSVSDGDGEYVTNTAQVSVRNPSDLPGGQIDIDGDGRSLPLSDGLLMIRFLAGFTHDALISGAVDPAGTRVLASQIVNWLTIVRTSALDVDGNGQYLPLTDGVLLIRFLAGFTGDSLVNGAVDSVNGTRTTTVEIEAYLAMLLPAPSGTSVIVTPSPGNLAAEEQAATTTMEFTYSSATTHFDSQESCELLAYPVVSESAPVRLNSQLLKDIDFVFCRLNDPKEDLFPGF